MSKKNQRFGKFPQLNRLPEKPIVKDEVLSEVTEDKPTSEIGRGLTNIELVSPEEVYATADDINSSVNTVNDTSELAKVNVNALRTDHDIPETWTDENVIEWFTNDGIAKGKTELGSFVFDPTRKYRPYDEWSDDELIDAANHRLTGVVNDIADIADDILTKRAKENETTEEVIVPVVNEDTLKQDIRNTEDSIKLEELVKQLRIHTSDIPLDWSTQEVVDFVKQGITPPKTLRGSWVNSVIRDNAPPTDWTTAELEDWAEGLIKNSNLIKDFKIAIELRDRLFLPTTSQDIETIVEQWKVFSGKDDIKPTGEVKILNSESTSNEPVLRKGMTKMNQVFIESRLEQFATGAKPGDYITIERGGDAQKKLDDVFNYVMTIEDIEGFKSGMDIIFDFVKKNRNTLFSESNALRFVATLPTQNNRQEAHINLLTLFCLFTSDVSDALYQVDINYLARFIPEGKRQLVLHFFRQKAGM
ncbi:virion structural protein [Pseudomonas phage vB_Pae10145-KEN51]|uniref:Structural protein n=1 Tax=Pseudomonas phage KTN4 TaxID=1862701 RepID=A0A192Y6A5_9CAUD|nr:structural protein [Pseudomonas phage KTN4]UXD83084.1 virion structural protein [Pseudomonas phage Koomba boorn-mokiny kep-wari Wadjak 1]WNV49685.1 hypothetical protein [Pseudomonas phage ANB1]WNV50084.1 hypothetical protein [Pseudomonas phage PhiPizzaParty]BBI55828.1 phage protein [Pseudomonas phage PA02]BDR25304.1 hypothetical protein RVBP15_1080 [Pseudomonas phage sp. 30-1]BDR26638.1 hypothetical protein RVBP18_2930 [Pseudomonas phage sp. LC]